jgi:oligoribonuclease
MATAADRLVWIDCEMTGLDLAVDELVEVAVVVTDYDLVPVHPGFTIVINPDQSALDNMGDFVRNMHTESGLIDEIPNGVSLADAEYAVLEYILKYVPGVDGHLHYRSVDVSSIKELARHWFPRVYFNAPAKNGGHRALADILESIRELDYYRKAVFTAEPGPTTEQVQTISAEVVERFAPHL